MRIIKDPKVLTSNHIPDKLLFRDELKKKIQDKVKIGVGNILLIGDTGTGKTVTIKKAIEEMNNVLLVDINCSIENTFATITKKTIKTLKNLNYFEAGKSRGQLAEDLIRVLKTKRQKKVVFLFDEIDKLIEKERDHQEILTPILENTTSNIILISNRYEALKKLESRIESRLHPEKIIVERYHAGQITDILFSRAEEGLEKNSYKQIVLAHIARHCYQTSGDIRDALSLLFEVSQLAESKQQKITLELLDEAQEKLEEIEFERMLADLTLHQLIIVAGVAKLSCEEVEGYAEINKLYNFYEITAKNQGSKPVGFRQFENIIKKLKFKSFVRTELRTPKNRRGRLSVVFPTFNVRGFMERYFNPSNETNENTSTPPPSATSFVS